MLYYVQKTAWKPKPFSQLYLFTLFFFPIIGPFLLAARRYLTGHWRTLPLSLMITRLIAYMPVPDFRVNSEVFGASNNDNSTRRVYALKRERELRSPRTYQRLYLPGVSEPRLPHQCAPPALTPCWPSNWPPVTRLWITIIPRSLFPGFRNCGICIYYDCCYLSLDPHHLSNDLI